MEYVSVRVLCVSPVCNSIEKWWFFKRSAERHFKRVFTRDHDHGLMPSSQDRLITL